MMETDILIIGAGGAGLAAAVAATEQEAKVIILEKRRTLGGNSNFAEGIFAAESPAQKRAAIEIRNDDVFKLAMSYAHWKINAGLVRAFINKSGDTVRWLEEKGVRFASVEPFSVKQLNRVFHNPVKGGPEIIQALIRECANRGVRILLDTAADKIMTDESGKVTGLRATRYGSPLHITARSVIITTGGFGGNKTLLKKYCNFYTDDFFTPGIPHMGDGLLMATEAGAATEGLGRLQCSGPAFSGNMPALSDVAREPNVLWLNKIGQRFSDESTGFNDFEAVNALFRQPGSFCYVLIDDKIMRDIMRDGFIRVYLGSLYSSGGPVPQLEENFQTVANGLIPVEQVNRELCNGCGRCVDLCPTSAINLDTAVLDRFEYSPCRFNCPAGVDMRRYLYLLKIGKFAEAHAVLREFLPLPSVTGRVCPHFCEAECVRKDVDDAVNINALERFIGDYGLAKKANLMPRKYTNKIAVIGSGPAGLACTYFLTRMGYPVTIFESQPVPGGMLRTGIPEYRLPKNILDDQINYIKDMGAEIKCGITIGKDIAFERLKKDYQAIFFATGNQLSRRIELEGSELEGVYWGLDFLRDVNLNKQIKVKDRVVVIGGGNVAIDVALTALRLGAKQVQVACLESGNEMPAYKEEIQQAIAEGVILNESWGPQRVIGDGGRVTGIDLMRCTQVLDADGKFNPSFDKKTTKFIQADMLILAIGQAPDHSLTPKEIKINKNGSVQTDSITLETNIHGIFAGGDIIVGTASVVKAISDGKEAAVSIDRYLRGEDLKRGRATKPGKVKNPPKEGIPCQARVTTPLMSVGTLSANFSEIKLGLDENMAVQEAQRCMTCGSRSIINIDNCTLCTHCANNCPVKAVYVSPVKKVEPLGKISDSLDEIAKWMKADPKVLEATIAEYNASCDRGYDSQFAKERRYLQALRTPPYYVFKCGVSYLVTMGGIRVNQSLEVVDNMDKPIPGLYAAGSDTGGYEADTYCVLLAGSTFSFAVNSGRIAGENAAKYVTWR